MPKKYSKADFLVSLQKAICNIDMFYNAPCLDYSGRTRDTKESYEDIAAEFVLDNLGVFEKIKVIERQSSYKVDGHEQLIPDENKINDIKNGDVQRMEEWLAKSMYGQSYEHIGKIIDFQVPIKNVRGDDAGKVDLISFQQNDNILYLLEFKRPNSKETLIRCILETYTYYKQVNRTKLLSDFNLPADSKIIPAVLIYKASKATSGLNSLPLKRLIEAFNISVFLIDEETDEVEKI